MKQKLTKFFNLIKNDKQAKTLTIITVLLLFIFTLGYSLAMFTGSTNKPVANIVVNGLSFNMTTNSGTSDDRIFRLKAGKKEEFNVVLTNLNKVNTKYELVYELCNNSNCTSTSTNIPSVLTIGKKDSNTEINGTINSDNKKTISILTNNKSSTDYYIKLNISAGYEWNDLALSNQINNVIDGGNITNIETYIDGTRSSKFPSSCAYDATIKSYNNNQELTNSNNTIKCDFNTKTWNTHVEGYSDRIVVNFTSTSVAPTTFANDSWETINKVVSAGKGYAYPVGSEKEITIDGKSYTIRVVNNTTPSECNNDDFSQTACGFVVEFVDIFTTNQKMFGSQSNKGGWQGSTLRTYLNGTFYDLLPDDLKKVIIRTKTISGHGTTSGETNFTTTDKIYLPSAKEIMVDSSKSTISTQDSAFENTRQLDYYQSIGLRASYDYLIKYKVGTTTATAWWLRTAKKTTSTTYLSISTSGAWTATNANTAIGITPVFRIGYVAPTPTTFAEDSWYTISDTVFKEKNYSAYPVGSEKEVKIDGTNYTVRVANNTTPEECSGTDFSQTACGFVVEFVDIVEKRKMNSSATNKGGWPASAMRTYVSGTFFNKLPEDLKFSIINTKTISGHGDNEKANFTTIEKLYLLSPHEVYEDDFEPSEEGDSIVSIDDIDMAYNNTRQLDYYSSLNVTWTKNCNYALKQYKGSNSEWWLRSSADNIDFIIVDDYDGNGDFYNANNEFGLAPAFRIG